MANETEEGDALPAVAEKNHSGLENWNYDRTGNPIEAEVTGVKPQVPEKRTTSLDSVVREDWGDRPRDAARYISKSNDAMRQQWEKEGGYQTNAQRALEVEAAMIAASPTLQNAITNLPKDIQLKAADHLRLSTAYGPLGGVLKAEQFLDSLSASEFESFTTWWRGLSRGDQDAILAGISR